MKALILCGGEGTRMRPLSYSQPKHLIPIANVPILDRIIAGIRAIGITEIGVVVSPSTKLRFDEFLAHYESGDTHIQTLVQHSPRGLADAVRCGQEFVGAEDFLLYLGDNLLQESIAPLVESFRQARAAAALSLIEVEDPRRFGVAEIHDGRIARVVEKPEHPPSNYALGGIYALTPSIFEGIENIVPSQRGELEITDAIQWLIERGDSVVPHYLTGWWKDVGQPEDMLVANALLLEQTTTLLQGKVDEATAIQGEVEIGARTEVIRSTLIGPVVIGSGTRITDCQLGPNVSIGDDCQLTNSGVQTSIVLEKAIVDSIQLEGSLLGRATQVVGSSQTSGFSLTLGDFSRVSPASQCPADS